MKSAVTEKAPHGQEHFIKKLKGSFKKRYGKKKGLSYLYATAWKRHNKESVNESDLSFQKFVEEYQPGDTFVKVDGQLGAVSQTSEDGKLLHVKFVNGGEGWYHGDKVDPVHKSPKGKSKEPYMHLKYGAMDEAFKPYRTEWTSIGDFSWKGPHGNMIQWQPKNGGYLLFTAGSEYLGTFASKREALRAGSVSPEDYQRSYGHRRAGEYGENVNITEAFEEGMLVKVIGNVVGKDIEGYITKVSPSGNFYWVQLRNGDVNAYHRSDIQAYDPSPDEEDDESEYGFEKGNNAATTVEPWAYEDDPRNPYNDSVQVERRNDDEDDEDEDDDYVYNADGKYVGSRNGTHDAGGHPSGEKMADRADYLSNFYKDESVNVESTGADCNIIERQPGKWYLSIQQYPYGDNPNYDEKGPFSSDKAALAYLNKKYANPGGYGIIPYKESLQTESLQFQKWIDSVKKLFADNIPSHGLLGLMQEGLIDKNEIRRAYKLGLSPDAALRYLVSDLHLAKSEKTKTDFKAITESVVNYLDNSQPGHLYVFREPGPVIEYRANNRHKVISLPSRTLTGRVLEQKEIAGRYFVRFENKIVDPVILHKFYLQEVYE